MKSSSVPALIRFSFFMVAFFLWAGLATPVWAETLYKVWSDGRIEQIDSDDASHWKKSLPDKQLTTGNMSWAITYGDPGGLGFNDAAEGAARKARLEDVLGYIAGVLNPDPALDVTVTLAVDVSLNDPDDLTLATAGTLFSSNFQNPFRPGFSLLRIMTGSQPFPNSEEIFMQVNFGADWHAGTGAPPGDKFDLFTVLLHEITHGLGFTTGLRKNGTSSLGGMYTKLDEGFFRGTDNAALFGGNPPNIGLVLPASTLESRDIVFNGANANERYAERACADLLPF